MDIRYVTGTDANRFLNTGMLVDSFARHMPGETLSVCDFGMTEGERAFWDGAGYLLPVPDKLRGHGYPWSRKAGFFDFLTDTDWDAVVWLDADMVLLQPIAAAVSAIVEDMAAAGQTVAACGDVPARTLQGFIDEFTGLGVDLAPFERLIGDLGSDRTGAYLNTGFLIVRPSPFIERWRDIVLQQDEWLLFEQNTFNALVHAGPVAFRILDAAQWNVHGEALGAVTVSGEPMTAKVLHATSQGQRHHIENEIEYPIGERVLPGWIKLFERDDLRAVQQEHIVGFLNRHIDAIDGAGLLRAPPR